VQGASGIAAQVYSRKGVAWLLLVNKHYSLTLVSVPAASEGAKAFVIDELSGEGPARQVALKNNVLLLSPYATAAIEVHSA
jgi:hypothetical protein